MTDKDEFQIQTIRGIPFPSNQYFNKKNIEDAMDYVPLDGDIIVASYPKTGTTWLQYIALQILTKGESFPKFDDLLQKIAPFMEMSGIEAIKSLDSNPRMYKHHLPYDIVQKNKKAKYMYTYRNPADTFVSYYHFSNSIQQRVLNFDEFIKNCISGTVGYGSYFKHVLSYLDHQDDPNVLLVSYEKLQHNRKEEILRIAEFLGKDYHDNLLEDEDLMESIMERTSFEYMKKNLFVSRPDVKKQGREAKNESEQILFFRKGVSGEGKKELSPEQIQKMTNEIKRVMQGTTIADEWLSEIEK